MANVSKASRSRLQRLGGIPISTRSSWSESRRTGCGVCSRTITWVLARKTPLNRAAARLLPTAIRATRRGRARFADGGSLLADAIGARKRKATVVVDRRDRGLRHGADGGRRASAVRRSHKASVVAEHSPLTHAPIVVVENANDETAAKDANEAAERAVAAVENGLSVFDHFVVRRRTKSTERGDIEIALSVATKPSGDGAANDFTFQLAHLPTNEIVWSRTFSQIGRDDLSSIDGMTEAVVAAVGELHMGAIMADQRRRTVTSHSPMRGYACLLEAYDYLLSRDSEKRGPARECLERELSLDPQDPHALTLLSIYPCHRLHRLAA